MKTRSSLTRKAVSTAGIAFGALWISRRWRHRARSVRGQVCVVTGGSRGLGLSIARQLAGVGCRLVICARDAAELDRARISLERLGAEVLAYPCDVAERAQVDQLVEAARARFGTIDIIVNNAGIIRVGPLDAMSVDDFEQAMAVNFWGPFHLIAAVLPAMRRRRQGQIINIASIGGEVSVPHLLPYGAAKAALVNFSEGLAAELSAHGISVTTVIPGLMRTGSPINASFKGDAQGEFRWFAIADSLYFTSMSAEDAAEQIVAAIRSRKGKVTLGWQAKALRMFHALFPNLAVGALGTANRFLPDNPRTGESGATVGKSVDVSPATQALTGNMRAAARDLNG